MALHNRLVKADLWRSTDLIRAVDGDPFGIHLYQGLWHMADDSGCLPDDELQVKIDLFAGFDVVTASRIRELMDALISAGKMIRYEVRGRTYLWLTNFHRHQTLDYPRQGEYPLPEWMQWEEGESRGQSRFLIFADKCPVDIGKDARRGFVVVNSDEGQCLVNDETMTQQRHDTESVSISISSSSSSSNSGERGESEGREGRKRQRKDNAYTPEFEAFWSHYPRKIEKAKAFRAWSARMKEKPPPSPDDLVLAAQRYTEECERLSREARFIKHGATFLGPDKPYQDYLGETWEQQMALLDQPRGDPHYGHVQSLAFQRRKRVYR